MVEEERLEVGLVVLVELSSLLKEVDQLVLVCDQGLHQEVDWIEREPKVDRGIAAHCGRGGRRCKCARMWVSFLFLYEDLLIRCLCLGLWNVLLLQLLLRWLRRLLLR